MKPATTKPTTPKNTLPLKDAPVEGRLDVVAYKVSERLVNAIDSKMGLGGTLWNQVSGMVEEVITENLPSSKIQIPEEVNFVIGLLRKNGVNIC